MTTYNQQLKTQGFVVVPCLTNVAHFTREFRDAISRFSEYKDPAGMVRDGTPFVKGGFAALGNPSSFHNTFVRKIRRIAHATVLDAVFLKELEDTPNLKFEQVIDRSMFRRPGDKPMAESWHRDESANCKPGDNIYGGWINLDSYSQFFSGCPTTHLEVSTNRGFAAIDNPKKMKRKRNETDEAFAARKAIAETEWTRLQGLKRTIEIPAGHIFIFYERMIHEVVPSPRNADQHRVFLGWRTTFHDTPLFPDIEERCKDLAIVKIKSGQMPWMYGSSHWMFHRAKLVEWSKNLKDVCTENKEMLSGAHEGKKFKVVHRWMDSLTEYGLVTDLCPPYSANELSLLKPNRYSAETETDEEVFFLHRLRF